MPTKYKQCFPAFRLACGRLKLLVATNGDEMGVKEVLLGNLERGC